MDDERITLRMGTEEVQKMDSFLEKNPSLGTRSLFIRTAVREYIDRDADVSAQPAQSTETGVFIKLVPEMYNHAKETAEDLWYPSVEEYLRSILFDNIRTVEERRMVARNNAVGFNENL